MKLVQSGDRIIQQFQTNVNEVLNPMERNVLLQGTFINNVQLDSAKTNIIPLGLNKVFSGYLITKLNANSVIWDTQVDNNTPNQTLYLNCSADCTVNLYVF